MRNSEVIVAAQINLWIAPRFTYANMTPLVVAAVFIQRALCDSGRFAFSLQTNLHLALTTTRRAPVEKRPLHFPNRVSAQNAAVRTSFASPYLPIAPARAAVADAVSPAARWRKTATKASDTGRLQTVSSRSRRLAGRAHAQATRRAALHSPPSQNRTEWRKAAAKRRQLPPA